MARIMTKDEKLEIIKDFDFVRNAKDEVWVGGAKGHMSMTAGNTKGGWTKHFMKDDYIMMDCGIPVRIDRPGIKSTVYYDDEYDSPLRGSEDNKKAAWMAYNLQYDAPNAYTFQYGERIKYHDFREDCRKPFVYDLRNQGMLGCVRLQPHYFDDFEQREYEMDRRHVLTEDEFNEYLACLDRLTNAYKKRLESYWKRYRNKISSYGYWANR